MHAAARDQTVPAARAPAAGTGAVCAQLAGHGQHRYLLPRFSSRTTVVGIPLIVAHDFRTTSVVFCYHGTHPNGSSDHETVQQRTGIRSPGVDPFSPAELQRTVEFKDKWPRLGWSNLRTLGRSRAGGDGRTWPLSAHSEVLAEDA